MNNYLFNRSKENYISLYNISCNNENNNLHEYSDRIKLASHRLYVESKNTKYYYYLDQTIMKTMSNSSGINKLNCDTFRYHSISSNLYSLKRGW